MAFSPLSLPRDSSARDHSVLHCARKTGKAVPRFPLSLGVSANLNRRVSSSLGGGERRSGPLALLCPGEDVCLSFWRRGRGGGAKPYNELREDFLRKTDQPSWVLELGKWRRPNSQRALAPLNRTCEINEPGLSARYSDSARAEEPLPAGIGGAGGNSIPAHRRNPEEKWQITVTS